MSDDEDETHCPLCVEEMDLSDRNFLPCPCGYRVCMWCWHHIRENLNGLCPACRTPYNEDPHAFSAVDRQEIVRKNRERRKKEKEEKKGSERVVIGAGGVGTLSAAVGGSVAPGKGPTGASSAASSVIDRRHLHNYRVVQRNLVYVIGIPSTNGSEDMLRKPEFFGQYGKIGKIVIHRNNHSNTATVSAYVTFVHKEDAKAAIQALDGYWLDQHLLRASFGTTKYCNNFIRGVPCSNPECVYLHDFGDDDDRFTKEEIQAGHSKIPPTPGKDQSIVTGNGGPSGTGKRPAGESVLPPPVFIQDNASSSSASSSTSGNTDSNGASTTTKTATAAATTIDRPAAVSRSGTATWGNVAASAGGEAGGGGGGGDGMNAAERLRSSSKNNSSSNLATAVTTGGAASTTDRKVSAGKSTSSASSSTTTTTKSNRHTSDHTTGNSGTNGAEQESQKHTTITSSAIDGKQNGEEGSAGAKHSNGETIKSQKQNDDKVSHSSSSSSSSSVAPPPPPATVPKEKVHGINGVDKSINGGAYNGITVCAVFPVPASSLSWTVWAMVVNNDSNSSNTSTSKNNTYSGDLSADPYDRLVLPFSDLLDLTLPPVDALGGFASVAAASNSNNKNDNKPTNAGLTASASTTTAAGVWPRPPEYYRQGLQGQGKAVTRANNNNNITNNTEKRSTSAATTAAPPGNVTTATSGTTTTSSNTSAGITALKQLFPGVKMSVSGASK